MSDLGLDRIYASQLAASEMEGTAVQWAGIESTLHQREVNEEEVFHDSYGIIACCDLVSSHLEASVFPLLPGLVLLLAMAFAKLLKVESAA